MPRTSNLYPQKHSENSTVKEETRKKYYPDTLAETRRYYLLKGYMNIADIEKFVPCGHPRAKMIFDTIRKNVELSGLENLDYNLVLTKRVVEFLGLDIDEMDKYGW